MKRWFYVFKPIKYKLYVLNITAEHFPNMFLDSLVLFQAAGISVHANKIEHWCFQVQKVLTLH